MSGPQKYCPKCQKIVQTDDFNGLEGCENCGGPIANLVPETTPSNISNQVSAAAVRKVLKDDLSSWLRDPATKKWRRTNGYEVSQARGDVVRIKWNGGEHRYASERLKQAISKLMRSNIDAEVDITADNGHVMSLIATQQYVTQQQWQKRIIVNPYLLTLGDKLDVGLGRMGDAFFKAYDWENKRVVCIVHHRTQGEYESRIAPESVLAVIGHEVGVAATDDDAWNEHFTDPLGPEPID